AGDSVMRPIAAVAGTPTLACGGAACSARCATECGTAIAASAAIIALYANARLRLCIDRFPSPAFGLSPSGVLSPQAGRGLLFVAASKLFSLPRLRGRVS